MFEKDWSGEVFAELEVGINYTRGRNNYTEVGINYDILILSMHCRPPSVTLV